MLLIFTLIIVFRQGAYAQLDGTPAENSHTENLRELTRSVFKYKEFTDGKVILKDSTVVAARLNFSRVLGQFLFISRQGKTLEFEHPETFDKIIIGADTFRYDNNSFLEKITHFNDVNLYVKQGIKYIEQTKNGNTGAPIVITNGSKLLYSDDDQTTAREIIEKNDLFQFINEYFLADKLMHVYPATKKSLYDLFPMHKDEVKTYLQDHSVNFTKTESMEKLLRYLQEL
ncbi:MAG: hypothetical protein ABI472_12960 [Ginsengibacter sp.]